jgi:hypothetical protein
MKKFCTLLVILSALAVAANAGTITGGSLTSLNDQDTYVDLTAEGTTDWVAWDQANVTGKAGGTAINRTLTVIGGSALGSAGDSRIRVSWTDGDPTLTGIDVRGFNHIGPNVGNGLSFTVAATEATQKLRVYVAGWAGEGIFTAALSGGGSYTETFSVRQDSEHQYGVFELIFSGAGETLTVTYTMGEDIANTTWANIGLQAATLANDYSVVNITPVSGAVDVDPAGLMMEWAGSTDPNIISVLGYTLYLDPNETHVTNLDAVQMDYFDDTIPSTQTTYAPAPDLTYETPYFWRIVETVQYDYRAPGDVNDIVSDVWSFTTKALDASPVVDAGPKFIMTTALAAMPFELKGTVTDDGVTPVTIGWQAFDVELGGGLTTKVSFTDAANPNTTVTISEAGSYVLKLTATDGDNPSVSDQKEIVVLDDGCQAIKSTGTWAANYYDINDDCVVDLSDFAVFALEWLDSTALDQIHESFITISDPDNPEQLIAEYWLNVAGTDVNDLIADPRFPDSPDGTFFIANGFRAPSNSANNFGRRIYGYLVPPVTGTYTFYIASDDQSRLFLGTDTTPVDTDPSLGNQIAEVPDPAGTETGWTNVDQWDKYPEQTSVGISLTAGQYYYIEALQKEGGSNDHLSVGWKLPDTSEIIVIPGTALRYTAP